VPRSLSAQDEPQRARNLLAQQKKRLSKMVGSAPVHEYVVGRGQDELPIRALQTTLMRLPRSLTSRDRDALDKRLSTLGLADDRGQRRERVNSLDLVGGRAEVPVPGRPPAFVGRVRRTP
jgi:hypothetical protein